MHFFIFIWLGDTEAKEACKEIVSKEPLASSAKWAVAWTISKERSLRIISNGHQDPSSQGESVSDSSGLLESLLRRDWI